MIIALSGPSGIGKGYIKDILKETYSNINEIVWLTTRSLRPNELVNSNRKNISEEEFEEKNKRGELALVQGMFGHRYAVLKKDFLESESVLLTEIHPYIIKEAKENNPNIVAIGLVTDDFDLLRDRLVNRRKTESLEEIEKRIESAKAEVAAIRDNFEYYDEIISIARDNEHLIADVAREMFAKYKKGGGSYVANTCREGKTQ